MGTTTSKQQDVHNKLLEALAEIDRPSEVCTSGDRPLTMPGLEVEGLGAVRLPLGKTQARKLIKLCRQAPYGKGTETVVDTEVRRVWELDPAQLRLTNPKWSDLVASLVEEVQQELGLKGCKLEPHLYKLLVYDEGSFFLPHRDGEKLDGMVATLVISLPSIHEGGELVVLHEGRQHRISFAGAASGYELSYAAFYADCLHEVRPVTSGFRLCLTYNVTLAKSRAKKGMTAPTYGATTAAITELLRDWRDVEKLAVTLEHRYTQDGLTVDTLKGIDRARAEVLFEAAEQAGCVTHLALVTLWQCGSAEGGYDEYRYGHGRGYRWSDDDIEDDYDETTSQYEMGEIYEHSLSASHWSDRHGNKVLLGEILVNEKEIVAEEAVDEWDPNCEDFEGYTGNAGMTLQRWYHRAAVVIWPREKHFQVLCRAGTDASIGGLQPLVAAIMRAPKSARQQQHQDCLSFARAIIDSWQVGPTYSWHVAGDTDRSIFPGLLCEVDEPDLVRLFLSQVMTVDGEIQLDKSFIRLCKKHGWLSFESALAEVVESSGAATIIRNAELLRMLCQARDKSQPRIELCARLTQRVVEVLQEFDREQPEGDWRIREIDRASLLRSLVQAMLAIDAEEPLSRLIEHVLASNKYDLTDAHLAVIFTLEKQLAKLPAASAAISRWLSACRSELESRTSQAPKKPTDFRRSNKLTCECADCAALSEFLGDPHQGEARFPLAAPRRQHLHQIIDGNDCDCTHVTERRGRPYTLVCTKTTASYDAACKIFERDQQNLTRIIRIAR